MNRYEQIARERLSGKRLLHSQGTADTAKKLAQRYGGDVQKAYDAGIVHDIAKPLDGEELLLAAEKYGVEVDGYLKKCPWLLHGPVAAAILEREYGVEDGELLRAVALHTTGGRDMSLLDKVIYLADLIEPGRDFPGVREIRERMYEGIDGALLLGVGTVLGFLIKKGWVIHPSSVDMYNSLIQNKEEEH